MSPLWPAGQCPLMLAPMQGLSNRMFRRVQAGLGRPDVVFTEFVRVRPGADKVIADSDFVEACATVPGVPLVVQVIGAAEEGVIEACRDLVDRGVTHINVNMGCPWGRMTSVLAGGGMFRHPDTVAPMLSALREIVPGTLSVKTRAGLDDPRELFAVLPAFADAGIDFLIVHPRTVAQKYKGRADHALVAEIVKSVPFAVIANGDVRDAPEAERVLATTSAAGLMLGRGAVRDPWLFERVRGTLSKERPTGDERRAMLAAYLSLLLDGYAQIFHGDAQILAKLREVLAHIDDEDQQKWLKGVKKARRVHDARARLLG